LLPQLKLESPEDLVIIISNILILQNIYLNIFLERQNLLLIKSFEKEQKYLKVFLIDR